MNLQVALSLIIILLTGGCVTVTPPTGPDDHTAVINDTFQRQSRSKGNFYFVESIDGRKVNNALTGSVAASFGNGSQLTAVGATRSVPILPLQLHLVGQVHHAARIGYIFGIGRNYRVEGDVAFTPEPNTTYLVKGSLSNNYSAVWLEDTTGKRVTTVIEKLTDGSSEALASKENALTQSPDKTPLSREGRFVQITSGESSILVVEKLGSPDSISERYGNPFSDRSPSKTYRYENLGEIQFSILGKSELFVEEVRPLALPKSAGIDVIKEQLMYSEGTVLQQLAIAYYDNGETDPVLLDLFASELWDKRHTDDPYTVDALSYFCKYLGKSGNPRYRTILERITTEARAKKLQKYARSSLELLPFQQVEQYIPME